MTRKIVAIGGGSSGRLYPDGKRDPYETGPMDREIIRLTGKEHPNFLFIAHASLPERQITYYETMKEVFGERYGCPCKDLKPDRISDRRFVDELIDWADIIYEGGGNTLDMIKMWKETGFDGVLKKAWEDGKVMCGLSAGANCWFKECSSDSLKIKFGPDQPLIGMECLGFIDGLYVPHCDEPGRAENVKDLLKTSDQIGLSMSNCTALEIIDDQYRLITSEDTTRGFEPYGLKSYWENGEYLVQNLDTSPEFKPLADLLKRDIKK